MAAELSTVTRYAYKPLEIIRKSANASSEKFVILNEAKRKAGSFQLWSNGYVSDLVIKRKFRRKKTSVIALTSIRDFLDKKVAEMGRDHYEFHVIPSNKHNLQRLYSRHGFDYIDTDSCGMRFFRILDKEHKEEIIENAHLFDEDLSIVSWFGWLRELFQG